MALATLGIAMHLGATGLGAQPAQLGAASEYDVKAAFIHHFAHYFQWPETSSSFEIAVLGESAIVAPLQAIAAKKSTHDRSIAIRPNVDLESLGRPQILFVARPAAPRLLQVLKKTQGKPILTIAEEEGFAARGVAVNFVLRAGAIKFEINENALRASVLQAPSQLLKLAILVGDRR